MATPWKSLGSLGSLGMMAFKGYLGGSVFGNTGAGVVSRRAIHGSYVTGARSSNSNSSRRNEGKEVLATGTGLPSEAVFYHPKHDMYVCWHPEVPFPYEMSKPIPTEVPGTDSVLKIQSLIPVREVFRKKNERLILRELVKLTYTPKYGFMGRFGKKKKYVLKEMDPLKQTKNREYL